MSSTQSLTAVVTDIRKIEMRYYPVPEAAQTDAVLKVELCGICGSDYDYYVHGEHWPYRKPPQILGMKSWVGLVRSVLRLRAVGKSRKGIWSPSRRRFPANAVATARRGIQLCARTSEVTE